MGSRSYFHYSDTLLVLSNGVYCGLDPLKTILSGGREDSYGGWQHDVTDPEPIEIACEARELFDGLTLEDETTSGATFRLPLRRADIENKLPPLGKPIDRKGAEKLLSGWAESLQDGRLLLFLSSVERVSVRRWTDGNPAPTVVAEVNKRYAVGTPFPRLPSQHSIDKTATFAELQAYALPLACSSESTL
jgi:hypothetical protein